MRRILVIAVLSALGAAAPAMAGAQTPAHVGIKDKVETKAKPLSDAALDKVTAGTVSAGISDGVVRFQGQAPTANGLVSSTGSLALQGGPIGGNTMGTLNLSGNAEQNLNSLVNINAVNSTISVLLNLNVNINSTVGTLTQANLNGKH
ncbi:hypothetical protein JAO29_18080 [Edaphobacter sp. HDX4]|uniref:hypothetical protein n=1 Tax=Edaphobacter sp. HDX4 TaxID=2794064 RepID=UPI002FE6A642